MKNLEVERRWLIEFPLSPEAVYQLIKSTEDIQYITQTYLKDEKENHHARVRTIGRSFFNDDREYYYTEKALIATGINEEDEKEISKEEYEKLLKKANPKKDVIKKVRVVFDYQDQLFELDIFKGNREGMAILEIELDKKDQVVILPSWLKVIKEITEEKRYGNYYLADRDWSEFGDVVQKATI